MNPDPDASSITALHRPSMRVAKAAALLEVDISTIYKLVRAGGLQAHRVGKRGVRVFADSLRAYQERQKIAGGVSDERANPNSKKDAKTIGHPAYKEAITYLQSIGCL